MTTGKQPDSEIAPEPKSISVEASSWIGRFVSLFEHKFTLAAEGLSADAELSKFHLATFHAFVQTFQDFGVDKEGIWEMIGIADAQQGDATEWNSELNARRFELIDKEIQGTLSLNERVELASLTARMRQHVDSEINMPMEGARKLYESLLKLRETGESN